MGGLSLPSPCPDFPAMLHTRVTDRLPALESLPEMPSPGRVLLTTPEHFRVAYVINPHMEGNVGTVDRERARRQWEHLAETYRRLGLEVHTIEGAEGLPDMVFCANQTLPYRRPDGGRGVVLSQMHAPQRRPEVEHYARFFEGEGYEIRRLSEEPGGAPALGPEQSFEGMGDALWHPGRRLLWGGHGFRTDLQVYEWLAAALGVPVLALHLADPDFYHLDTCFCLLDERSVLIYPGAFDEDGLGLIHHYFERVIEAPEDEARGLFACNAHAPDGRHVIIQEGCTEAVRRLSEAGFEVLELETDEFLKAGGSVFCMKLMFW